jgi:UDP:flavonoid glycosyltransferase YjiC (YdhE family)
MYSPQLCRDTDLAWGYPYPEISVSLPNSLRDFINEQKSNQRPIFLFTLGSMDVGQREKERLIKAFVEGTEALGAAALVLGFEKESKSATSYYFAEFVRYTALFPQVDLIVSHCGAGTTHLALFSGKPVFALPFLPDQLTWAQALRQNNLLIGEAQAKDFSAASFKKAVETGFQPERIAAAHAAGEQERRFYANASQNIASEIQGILARL